MDTEVRNSQTEVHQAACCNSSPEPTNDLHPAPESLFDQIRIYIPAVISGLMLFAGMALDHFGISFFSSWVRILWYSLAYIPVGVPVLIQGWKNILKGDFFTEFFLMGIATLGAFAIGDYPEAVAVMLFYSVGDLFQHAAVDRARRNIKSLLEMRPETAAVFRNNSYQIVDSHQVETGEKIQVLVGERIPLDGKLISEKAVLNAAAITGESRPSSVAKGDAVYAGSINLENVIEIKTTRTFDNSSIARIIHLVEEASSKKSKTEHFIRKFARVYTPIVVFMALALVLIPYFFVSDYIFREWLYRALVFLVISCPCALVISIPLGYFGGLGAASRNGILFKGASFLDAITKVTMLGMDKTGTVTKGVFKINKIHTAFLSRDEMMAYLIAVESQSSHPIARAIQEYENPFVYQASEVEEIAGKGLKAIVEGKPVVAGNRTLMKQFGIELPKEIDEIVESLVLLGIDNRFAGYVIISDKLKEDSPEAVTALRKSGIKSLFMLSGDDPKITEKVGRQLGLDQAIGGLLPEDKLNYVKKLKENPENFVAFAGDGINDAPVLAISDVGIAMGGLGSDVAIETADVVIQTDQPVKIAKAIKIGRSTKKVVWQNIGLAFGVKVFVLALGAMGYISMWAAVFADVGVALLAILNAIRLQRMTW